METSGVDFASLKTKNIRKHFSKHAQSSLNHKGAYCVMLRSSKDFDTCKTGRKHKANGNFPVRDMFQSQKRLTYLKISYQVNGQKLKDLTAPLSTFKGY